MTPVLSALVLWSACSSGDGRPKPTPPACPPTGTQAATATEIVGYLDRDGDGEGDPEAPVSACDLAAGDDSAVGTTLGNPAVVAGAADCDDTDPTVSPNAEELCNGRDDDCDGLPEDADACGPIVELHGYVGQTSTGAPREGVSVCLADAREEATLTAADGSWRLTAPDAELVQLELGCAACMPTDAWIGQVEATLSVQGYSVRIGAPADLDALYALHGATRRADRGTLMVDALDPGMSDIGGARVALSLGYESAWQSIGPDTWVEDNLTSEDWNDLVFLNVEPGPATFVVAAPDGTPCEGASDVVIEAGRFAMVSYYCTYKTEH